MLQLARGPNTWATHRSSLTDFCTTAPFSARMRNHIHINVIHHNGACCASRSPAEATATEKGLLPGTWSGCCHSTSSSSSKGSKPSKRLRWLPRFVAVLAAANLGLTVHQNMLGLISPPPFSISIVLSTMAYCTTVALVFVAPFLLFEHKIFKKRPPLSVWLLVAGMGACIGAAFALPSYVCPIIIAGILASTCYWLVSKATRFIIRRLTASRSPTGSRPGLQYTGNTWSARTGAESLDAALQLTSYDFDGYGLHHSQADLLPVFSINSEGVPTPHSEVSAPLTLSYSVCNSSSLCSSDSSSDEGGGSDD